MLNPCHRIPVLSSYLQLVLTGQYWIWSKTGRVNSRMSYSVGVLKLNWCWLWANDFHSNIWELGLWSVPLALDAGCLGLWSVLLLLDVASLGLPLIRLQYCTELLWSNGWCFRPQGVPFNFSWQALSGSPLLLTESQLSFWWSPLQSVHKLQPLAVSTRRTLSRSDMFLQVVQLDRRLLYNISPFRFTSVCCDWQAGHGLLGWLGSMFTLAPSPLPPDLDVELDPLQLAQRCPNSPH